MAWFRRKGADPAPDPVTTTEEPTDPGEPTEPRVFAPIAELVPAGPQDVWVALADGRAQVLAADDAELLARCDRPATAADHIDRLARQLRLERGLAADRVEALLEAGLLVDERRWCARLGERSAATGPAAIACVAVTTCARPAAAARCAESYAPAAAVRGAEFVIADDDPAGSGLPVAQRAHARYLGHADRRRFADELAARGHADEVRFALDDRGGRNRPVGANRNAVLLWSAGAPCFLADDDTYAALAPPPESAEGTVVTEREPTAWELFSTRAEALASAAAVEDPLAPLEAILGARGCAEVTSIDVDGATLAQLTRPGAVGAAVACYGLAGDSGMGSNHYYLSFAGASRRRLADDFGELFRTRAVVRAAPRLSLSTASFFMAPAAAYDGRVLLPPFPPLGRAQDAVFGAALRIAQPTGLIAHLPGAVAHDPPEDRGAFRPDAHSAPFGRLTVSDALRLLLRLCAPPAAVRDPAHRMTALGRALEGIGRAPAADLTELLRTELLRSYGASIAAMDRLLAEHDEPDEWVAAVEQAIEAASACFSGFDAAVVDLEAPDTVGDVVAGYGRLLQAWPDIVAAARALREERS